MDSPFRLFGRLLYAVPFLVFGFRHQFAAAAIAPVVPGWVWGGVFWVYVTGLIMIVSAVCMLVDRWIRPAALTLAIMLAVFIFTVHIPGLAMEARRGMALSSLLKDTALAGGALLIAGMSAQNRPAR